MKRRTHCVIFFLVWCFAMNISAVYVNATSLDKYREILSSAHFTFKYRTLSYSTKETRNATKMSESIYMTPSNAEQLMRDRDYIQDRVNQGYFTSPVYIFVMDGGNRYTEMEMGGNCKLIKDGEVYTFRHVIMYNSLNEVTYDRYVGGHVSKKGYVHQDEIMPGKNYWSQGAYLIGERSFQSQEEIDDVGAPMLMKMLAAIYPVSKANVELPQYRFVKSGQTNDGNSYEDYSGEQGGRFHAVRCYFQSGDLVKMAYASYIEGIDRPQDDAEKYVIEIEEFSPEPEQRYFSLPSELKVIRE